MSLKQTDPKFFRDTAKDLRKFATEIEGLASMMDKAGMKTVMVDGHWSLGEGIKAIRRFRANGRRAIDTTE